MVSFKPYKGGDDLLWALNQLCNGHKHEMVTATAMYVGGGDIKHMTMENVISYGFPPIWNADENEMVLAHLKAGSKFEHEFRIRACMSFVSKIDVLAGRPVDGILKDLAATVRRIVNDLEAKAKEIGILK